MIAGRLARAVVGARTQKKRYRALLAVMKAAHVGVYRPNGRPIFRGAERRAGDLYAYDFELKLIADALRDKQTIPLAEVAAVIENAASKRHLRAPTAQQLDARIVAAIRAAQKRPRARNVLGMLLVSRLGRLGAGSDFAGTAPAETVELDALQAWLVEADIAAGLVQSARHHHRHRGRHASARSPSGETTHPCQWLATKAGYYGHETYELGKLARTIWKTGELTIKVSSIVKALAIDAAQAAVIQAGVQVTAIPSGSDAATHRTHYGPAGHDELAGKQLRFGVHAQMNIDLTDVVVKCGYLLGFSAPAAGDVEDLPVSWSSSAASAADRLENHGSLTYGPGSTGLTTDRQGDAFNEFEPKREALAGIGRDQHAYGSLIASVDVQKPFGGWLSIGFLLPRKVVRFPYAVSYHQARGYEFHLSADSGQLRDADRYGWDDVREVEGYVCGSNPFGSAWQLTGQLVNQSGGQATRAGSVSFGGQGEWDSVGAAADKATNGMWWLLELEITDQPATMHFRGTYARKGTATAAITEDTEDCPPLP